MENLSKEVYNSLSQEEIAYLQRIKIKDEHIQNIASAISINNFNSFSSNEIKYSVNPESKNSQLNEKLLEESVNIQLTNATQQTIGTLLNKISNLEEDIEAVHLWLDDRKAPRFDASGEEYSIVGRIMQLLK